MGKLNWWDDEDSGLDAYEDAMSLHAQMDGACRSDCEDYADLYDQEDTTGNNAIAATVMGRDVPTLNVIQSVTDLMASTITKNKVRPFFLTVRGNHDLQQKARGMTDGCTGVLQANGMYSDNGFRWCLDGLVWGTGYQYAWPDFKSGRARIDRVFPWEVFHDDPDGRGDPRVLHLVTSMPRSAMAEAFSDDDELAALIKDAPIAPEVRERYTGSFTTEDRIRVVHSWHLPSSLPSEKNPSNGRYVCSIEGHVLISRKYDQEYFPVVGFSPKQKLFGNRGRGVPETLLGLQIAINRWSRRIEQIMNHHSRPLCYVNRRANVNTAAITNDYVNILEGDMPAGAAVTMLVSNSVPSELIQRVQTLIAAAYQQWGSSELSAAGTKPAGVQSGKALRTLLDAESVRNGDVFRAWEDSHVTLSRVIVDCLRALAVESTDLTLVFGDSQDLKELKWSEISMETSQYHMRVFPTNFFSQHPSSQMEEVLEFFDRGIFPLELVGQALDFPDIQKLMGDYRAAQENIERKLDSIERGKTDVVVHGYLNLALAKRLATDRLNRLEADGIEEGEVHDLMTRFFEDVVEKLKELQPPAPPMAPALPAPPMAA
jgi:hypothetical protein